MQVNNQQQKYKYPGFLKTAAGIVAGGVASSIIKNANLPVEGFLGGKIIDVNNSAKDSFETVIIPAAEQMLEQTGLKSKGVKIVDAGTKEYYEKYVQVKDEIFKKLKFPEGIRKILNPFNAIHKGENAAFIPVIKKPFWAPEEYKEIFSGGNEVHVAKDKLSLATFHELGHAINHNLLKSGKILQKISAPAAAAGSLLAIIALFKAPKAEGEKPKGFFDKTTTFVKRNAGKIVFVSLLPKIAEEGLASIHAAKWAKKLLSPELAKKVNKTNAFGFTVYFVTAVLAGVGTCVGVALRDKIAHKTPIDVMTYHNRKVGVHQG